MLNNLFFAALMIGCVRGSVAAQDAQPLRPIVIGEERGTDGTNCEETMAVLDLIAQDAEGEGKIIMIARLGRGESSGNLARLRVRGLRHYLHTRRGVAQGKLLTAQGERVSRLGQVEIYVGGRLHTVFHLKRNREFLGDCGV